MDSLGTAAAPLIYHRKYKVPRERVWAAFTNPESVRRWFGPHNAAISDFQFDSHVGGAFWISMQHDDGKESAVGGSIRESSKPERFVYTCRWSEPDPMVERDTLVTALFHERDDETELELVHENLPHALARIRFARIWDGGLERLESVLRET